MNDLRWFARYVRESWHFISEDWGRWHFADALIAALVALPISLLLVGATGPESIELRHVAVWLFAAVFIQLLVVAPFRIWQMQDLRSAMQHVRIADLEFQLAELNNHQEPDEDVVLQLDGVSSRG
jgi:hypothetical protein